MAQFDPNREIQLRITSERHSNLQVRARTADVGPQSTLKRIKGAMSLVAFRPLKQNRNPTKNSKVGVCFSLSRSLSVCLFAVSQWVSQSVCLSVCLSICLSLSLSLSLTETTRVTTWRLLFAPGTDQNLPVTSNSNKEAKCNREHWSLIDLGTWWRLWKLGRWNVLAERKGELIEIAS